MSIDHARPDDWADPGPRILPWCLRGREVRGPFAEICHARCPVLACACPCHQEEP